MNIVYIGGGYVGTCSAAVSANSGHTTLVYDIDQTKMELLGSGNRDAIETCLFEEGLVDLLVRNKEHIIFTHSKEKLKKFLDTAEVVFMCLPTPEIGETGESNLNFYRTAAQEVAHLLMGRNNGKQENYIVIVNKSTVPIDMIDETTAIMQNAGVKNYGVVSNPEFLVEGKAIQASLKPDRIVVGAKTEQDFIVMRKLYQRFFDSPTVEYIEVSPQEAEAGKLLANFYLFNKLAVCFDVIGRTCEAFPDLQFENIRRILTSDERIGSWGFYDSLYAGGSCFIKDARSLSHQLQTKGYEALLVNETYLANKRQLELFLGRATKEAHIDWSNKTITILGLAFKRDTNDIRNAAGVEVMNILLQEPIKCCKLYDPVALTNVKKYFSNSEKIMYTSSVVEAIEASDIVLIATDWPQFRELGDVLLQLKNRPLIMDGRRMLQHRYDDLQKSGFDIIAVGSPFIKGV
jgi:UDPglucose 6-dehydrogenase